MHKTSKKDFFLFLCEERNRVVENDGIILLLHTVDAVQRKYKLGFFAENRLVIKVRVEAQLLGSQVEPALEQYFLTEGTGEVAFKGLSFL